MSFATLPDSGCGYMLSELNRLFYPRVLLPSVISVILMTYKGYKGKRPQSRHVPIPRFALSVKSTPHFLSTTSPSYTSTSPTGCPVQAPFTMLAVKCLDWGLFSPCNPSLQTKNVQAQQDARGPTM
eukprot:1140332-Pelagomonas_calceolata.AAC.1